MVGCAVGAIAGALLFVFCFVCLQVCNACAEDGLNLPMFCQLTPPESALRQAVKLMAKGWGSAVSVGRGSCAAACQWNVVLVAWMSHFGCCIASALLATTTFRSSHCPSNTTIPFDFPDRPNLRCIKLHTVLPRFLIPFPLPASLRLRSSAPLRDGMALLASGALTRYMRDNLWEGNADGRRSRHKTPRVSRPSSMYGPSPPSPRSYNTTTMAQDCWGMAADG